MDDKRLVKSTRHRKWRGGRPASAHKLRDGFVRKAPVHMQMALESNEDWYYKVPIRSNDNIMSNN